MGCFFKSQWIDYEAGALELREGEVHLWRICPSKFFVRYLSLEELRRYQRIVNEEVKISYCSAQGGLRKIASAYMGCLPEEVRMSRGPRGKPYVPGGPQFNLSHSAGMILAAFSSSPVGVDVESTQRRVEARAVARKFFFPDEIRRVEMTKAGSQSLMFLRYWICKEAMVKLSGDGIYYGLRYGRVDLASDHRSSGTYKGRLVCLQEFRLSHHLIAALASWQPLQANGFFRI
jgi:phosphopantetheine--protein transferase-like protein